MSEIKGTIFDMDGVLPHSSGIHPEAFREVLADLPVRLRPATPRSRFLARASR